MIWWARQDLNLGPMDYELLPTSWFFQPIVICIQSLTLSQARTEARSRGIEKARTGA